ncbi:MAG: hypothetical protein IPP40_00320 [bacterium]|nr:hypothetical protein [bacterium]
MSKRIRKLERGAADLVTIAVGMTILAIAAIGTSYSLLYGREALIHQEHYKTALYKLRGFMEEETARIRFAASYRYDPAWLIASRETEVELDSRTDRDGRVMMTTALLRREAFDLEDDALTSLNPDYYRVKCTASWEEPIISGDLGSEDDRERKGPERLITLQSTFIIPN